MSAIEAATVGVRTMADGTLRLTIDIEPWFARDAFGLFGAPGTPCALAALRVGAEASPEREKPKGGPLAKLAGQWCKEPAFQEWVAAQFPEFLYESSLTPEQFAREIICIACRVLSRADLDHDKYAATRFEVVIRQPYMSHLNGRAEGRATQ